MYLSGCKSGDPVAGQYVATFTIAAPKVSGHTPSTSAIPPLTSVRLQFDLPIDQSSFSLTEDVVSFSGPRGAVAPTEFLWD